MAIPSAEQTMTQPRTSPSPQAVLVGWPSPHSVCHYRQWHHGEQLRRIEITVCSNMSVLHMHLVLHMNSAIPTTASQGWKLSIPVCIQGQRRGFIAGRDASVRRRDSTPVRTARCSTMVPTVGHKRYCVKPPTIAVAVSSKIARRHRTPPPWELCRLSPASHSCLAKA